MRYKKISDLFLRDGNYHFARWSKPIAPVIFGVDQASLTAIKAAFSDVLKLTSVPLSDFDPDLGANLLIFFCSEWSELSAVPNLNRLILDLPTLLETLQETEANQYRIFSFTRDGAINSVVILLRYDRDLSSVSVQTLSTSQMLQSIIFWSPNAFTFESPIAVIKDTNRCVVKPFFAALIRAAYDPVMPCFSKDIAHAIRLEARVSRLMDPQ